MKWVLFKCLIWNANDSVVKLMGSITSGVLLWYKPCYKNMLNLDNKKQIMKTYDNIKADFLWLILGE